MKITTGQVAETLGLSTDLARKLGACGLLGSADDTSARQRFDLATVQRLAAAPPARPPAGARVLAVSLGRPGIDADGRSIGWHDSWPAPIKRAAAAGYWQAPRDIDGLAALVAPFVVGVWRVRGADVDGRGFAYYDLVDLTTGDDLIALMGARVPVVRGPNRFILATG